MPGRRPLSPGMARTDRLATRVRPAAKDAFLAVCKHLNLTEADGLRKAAEEFTTKYTPRSTR